MLAVVVVHFIMQVCCTCLQAFATLQRLVGPTLDYFMSGTSSKSAGSRADGSEAARLLVTSHSDVKLTESSDLTRGLARFHSSCTVLSALDPLILDKLWW